MRTRNSTTPKSSPPPKKTLPARRTAAKTPTVYMPDSAPKLRETKRQAAIKAKQAMLNDTAPSPPKSQPEDEIDVNVGDDAGEAMPQASSSDKTVAKKGKKRTRGPAKGKPPATRKMKSAEDVADGNVDVEMTEDVIEIHGKEGNVTEKIVQMDGNNEDAPPVTVTSEIINKEAIEIDHVTVNNGGEPSDVCAKEEQEKETIETKNHVAVDFGESSDLQKNECYSEAETIARLTENEEKKGIAMEGGDYANSQPLVVNETIIVPVGKKIDCQPASTDAHTLVKAPGESTKAEVTANLNGDIVEGADVQHDLDELKESKKINTIEVNGDAEELAAIEEDTLNEVAGKDKQLAGAFCDSGVSNSEVNDANCLDIHTMDNNNSCEDPEEFKKAEGDAKPGTNTDGMAGDGKKHEKENGQGSNTKDVDGCFKGIKSCENQGVDVINDLGEKTDELKGEENLERNTSFIVDSEKLEEEHREWTAVAKERRIKKEHEVFISGIGGDTKEDDLRKVFEKIGEVAEVRLHKQSMLNKNKGYAFVRFADKEHVKRALIEIKEPIIGGLSCSIGRSEDDDTLFLGNVCNTWTKEAIKQKLKDYGVEGVENITLVPDAQREGFSRGFAFLEFSCHDDAAVAYQRLRKPDVIFGHAERTAKVAFAEPLRDPDPDVMLKVKTVFLDGLPSTCDEKCVREKVRGFGEIERIVLARNMTTAKRKDFGFVHFTTHEAAVACIDSINSIGLDDGNEKTKVKARLSNPLPKTQAVKDGMAGGFRIGFSSSGGASKPGRGLGRDGHIYRQGDSARGRGSYQRVYGQPLRGGFSSDYHHDTQFSSLVSGQAGSRSGFRPRGELPVTGRPFILNHIRPMSVPGDAIHGMHREPFHFEGGFGRHHNQRQLDDSHAYGHGALGIKRPLHMIDLEPVYMEPSRRPRFNYANPPYPTAAPYSSHGTQIQDAQGPLPDIQPHNYHGPPASARPHDYYAPPASSRPHDYYRPPASARPHGYNEPPNARPHVYNGPPNARPHGYNGPPIAGPHAYYGPPTSIRPPEYYGPPANIHAHSGPDVSKYLGGMRPPAHRGHPPYGGGFNY